MNKRIIPILLLKEGALVKGQKYKNFRYLGDPINAIKIFNDKEVDELIFLDIDATNEMRCIDIDFVEKVAAECYMPFAVGGGISSIAQIRKLLKAGAEKVSINTHAIENPEFIKQASDTFGSQSIVVSIDVIKNWRGKHIVTSNSGTNKTNLNLLNWAQKVAKLGAGEILINCVYNDGLMKGYDLEIIKQISAAVNIPVIASCGAGKVEDINKLFSQTQASAAAAGSLFVFHGPRKAVLINYPDYKYKGKTNK